ncbi:MAG: (Fe-S)-binding protein [Bacillota bacterium]|nr:(Fe-S)-binding protein [Bacillota bacterium]
MSLGLPDQLRAAALAELAKCNKCGFCLTACPTYLATGVEWEVARGRIALVKAALDGTLKPDELPMSVWSCLLCRNCLAHCPPGVEMDRIMVALRAALAGSLRVSPVRRFIMRGILPRRGRLEALVGAGRVAQAVSADRVLDLVPDSRARAARRFAPRLCDPRFVRRQAKAQGLYQGGDDARVAVFLGCATEFGLPEVALSLGHLLRELDIPARLVPGACCGLPAHSWGDLEGAKQAARSNLALLADAAGAPEHIITPCASCASFLCEYPALFSEEGPEGKTARLLASRVLPASIYLARQGLPELLRRRGRPVAGFTFHYPCHLAHYLGGAAEARDLLRALPGNGFVEMREPDSCCGAAGSFAFTHPEHAQAILERKMERVAETGAPVLATACPACLAQLAGGVKGAGLDVQVLHLLELAWRSLSPAQPELGLLGPSAAGAARAAPHTGGAAGSGLR